FELKDNLLYEGQFDFFAVFFRALNQDRLQPFSILCRQHSRPSSNTFLPRRPTLPCFIVNECQIGRSPCLLESFEEQRSLTNVLLSLRRPLAVSVSAAGDYELVDRIPGRIRDDDRNTASVEQHCSDWLFYKEVEK